MSVSTLREITIGVADLDARRSQMEMGCCLQTLSSGTLSAITASRLFDLPAAPRATLLGRNDRPGTPRIRLVEAPDFPIVRGAEPFDPGALGIGFRTRGIASVAARLQRADVRFASSPVRLDEDFGPGRSHPVEGARAESYGRSRDGDYIILTEVSGADAPESVGSQDCSAPFHAAFVVTNLDAVRHFMRDALDHHEAREGVWSGPPFDTLLGLPAGVSFRHSLMRRTETDAGALLFVEFERRLKPPPAGLAYGRGVCRLRFDTDDLHGALERVPGGGGSLVRGPAAVDDAVLGRGLVALVRAPFGIVVELWQPT